MSTATIETMPTPDGPFTLLADEAGRVLASGWTADEGAVIARLHPRHRPTEVESGRTAAAEAVGAYYAGELSAIDGVEVIQFGTERQLAGWRALRRIPPGKPLAYAAFAAELGAPTAVRAAAAICARNAPALFVPCHRVLRTDGSLGGFAWGVAVKRALLARETSYDLPAGAEVAVGRDTART